MYDDHNYAIVPVEEGEEEEKEKEEEEVECR